MANLRKDKHNLKEPEKSRTHRLVTAAFGVFFTGLALTIPIISELTFGPIAAAVIIGFLGVEAIVSSYRNHPSLLSRIGPLP